MAWRRAVGTLMARSPAILSAPEPGNEPSAGNDSTSVGLFLPRNSRLSRRMTVSVVSRTVTRPLSRTAAWANPKKPASVRAEGKRKLRGRASRSRTAAAFPRREAGVERGSNSEAKSGSRRIIVRGAAPSAAPLQFYSNAHLLRFCRMPGLRLGTIFADLGAHLYTLAERQRQLLLLRLGRFIGTDYPLHKRVTHHIGILKVAEADALYPLQDIDRVQQARAPWIGQIDL